MYLCFYSFFVNIPPTNRTFCTIVNAFVNTFIMEKMRAS